MKVIRHLEDYDGGPAVVALGMFDGVHIGHQRLIREAVHRAHEANLTCIVCTFDTHPLSVVAPDRAPKLILTLEENLHKMELLQADQVLVQHFDMAFASCDPEAFVAELVRKLNAKCIVVGENYTFGRRGKGDAAMLRALSTRLGFEAVVIPPVMDGARMASSTYIRELLAAGEMEHAERLLAIDGT